MFDIQKEIEKETELALKDIKQAISKDLLVNELLVALKDCVPEGIENCCDECGGDITRCFDGCYIKNARILIAKIERE